MMSYRHKDVKPSATVEPPPPPGALVTRVPAPAGPPPSDGIAAAPPRIGKYVPIRELGVGAMGMVYLCSQPGLERPVAVKVMIAGRHASPEQILRFQREAWAAAQLSHPNVLQIYDVGREG